MRVPASSHVRARVHKGGVEDETRIQPLAGARPRFISEGSQRSQLCHGVQTAPFKVPEQRSTPTAPQGQGPATEEQAAGELRLPQAAWIHFPNYSLGGLVLSHWFNFTEEETEA